MRISVNVAFAGSEVSHVLVVEKASASFQHDCSTSGLFPVDQQYPTLTKDREGLPRPEDFEARQAGVVGRSQGLGEADGMRARERLRDIVERDAGRDDQAAVHKLGGRGIPDPDEEIGRSARKPSVNQRLKDVLNTPRAPPGSGGGQTTRA